MEDRRIVVTGATGFLGRHLLPRLRTLYGDENVVGISSRDYDLMDPVQARRMFDERNPDVVVHLAAYSGGIGANSTLPADFYYRNTLLTALVFEQAAHGIKKLIYTMGGCSYPATATSPIDESQMWNGYPQPESAAYSAAKKMGIVASTAYRKQYGLNSVVLIPGNMYGEYDNFRNAESHVVPAMVRRYYEARLKQDDAVVMWGSGGRPARDFVYAGDVAASIPYFIEHDESSGPVNLSSGTTTQIRELAETIKELTGYQGDIVWDKSKPDGQMVKIFDVSRMRGLGLSCETSLREGLCRTIDWLGRNYRERSDGIRL